MSSLYLTRQGSGASEQPPRSDSRLSDYSGALPDLESQLFDDEDGPILFSHKYLLHITIVLFIRRFLGRIFKGTVSRDFSLLVFFINQFPPAPEYPIRTVSKFFENSRRYSQLKVDYR